MKQFIFGLFGKQSALDLILNKSYSIEARTCPSQLIKQIKGGQLCKFIAIMNTPQPVSLLALRKLTIIHYLLIHCPGFCEQFEEIEVHVETQDKWLTDNVLHPYSAFLYKIINSGGLYEQCKSPGILEISFRMLFFIVNTLKELFPCVRKMSNLSRYYTVNEKQLRSTLTTDYVLVHTYEAQELYNRFKAILGEMIKRPQLYLKTETDKQMIKYILQDVVVKLNEEMKNLFLDKYYFPYGKGYGVRLFKEEELTGASRQFMQKLALMQILSKPKKAKKLTLDKILFGESGHLNPQIYHSLSQIRQGDEFLSQKNHHSMKNKQEKSKAIDEHTENI